MASETEVINMALGRIGAKRINDFTNNNEDNLQSVQARLHYAQTRDALIRSHSWRFARSRATLSANAAYSADTTTFEWTSAYDLPNDFLRMQKPFEDFFPGETELFFTYALEGKQLLSNESTMKIRYVRRVEDVAEFDPLFVEVLVLQLALKFVMPLAKDKALWQVIFGELWGVPGIRGLMSRVRTMDKRETNTTGRTDRGTWNDARITGSGNPAKRSG